MNTCPYCASMLAGATDRRVAACGGCGCLVALDADVTRATPAIARIVTAQARRKIVFWQFGPEADPNQFLLFPEKVLKSSARAVLPLPFHARS